MKFILLLILLGADAILIYISSLYAPDWFWALAYATLVGIVILGFFYPKSASRIAPALIGSVIINSHYLFTAISAPNIEIIGYAVGLLVAQSVLLFAILKTAR